jgi:4-hydroxyphenylpyruvate dioxygenase-like putative hemolysin
VANGAKAIEEPYELKDDEDGTIVLARIASPYGDVIHTLVDRSNYTGTTFMPLFHKNSTLNGSSTPTRHLDGYSKHGLTHIDHVTLAYEQGFMYQAMDWYSKCLGNFQCSAL